MLGHPRHVSMALGLSLLVSAPALAGSEALQQACFPPQTLLGLPGEHVPAKGDRRFDMPRKLGEAPALPPVAAAMRGAIRRVDLPKGEKLIALTFDLCEDRGEVAGYEGRIFDYLRQQNVKATLFAGGKWLRSHQARAEQLMTDPLFEIGNHSDTHRNTRIIDQKRLDDEIHNPLKTYHALRAHLAETQCAARVPDAIAGVADQMRLFRFPFGACNDASMAAVNDAGMLAIQWDVSTGDPDPHQTLDAIVHAMVHRTKPGSIVIAHANGRGWKTADALPIAIPQLKAMGYQFVTVSELLARGKPVIAPTCYDNHPGDTDRYDHLHEAAAAKANKGQPGAEILPWQIFQPSSAPP